METKVGTPENPLRVAIIGSGPSGFYAADALQSQDEFNVEIDMFDRLPTPHGLVRGGVAPDHAKIKSVTKIYDRIAQKPNFRFYGNVEFGTDITLDELRKHYHQIVFAVGAQTDKSLNIPGEDLTGSHAATEFVAWYNGHPDYRDYEFDLSAETAIVVGIGNVAMDVARILAKTYDELYETDIADYALEALKNSNIKNIYVLGRRGPVQAKFTNKEIREFGKLEEANVVVYADEMEIDPDSQAYLDSGEDRNAVNNVKILNEFVEMTPDPDKPRTVYFRFMVSPVEIIGEDQVEAVKIVKNELVQDDRGRIRPQPTDKTETIPAGLIFRSVGYRGVPLKDVPFRDDWGTIPNEVGRVTAFAEGQLGDVVIGEYVVGWIKRGPSGVIGTNKPDAQETVDMMLADVRNGVYLSADATSRDTVETLLHNRDVEYVTYDDWLKLDELELSRGKELGRDRVKFTRIDNMLQTLREIKGTPTQ